MKKYLKAGALVVALALMGAGIRSAFAYTDGSATKYGDVQVSDLKLNTGNIVDSNGTTRVAIGATNAITGNATVSGNAAISGNTATVGLLSMTSTSIGSTPLTNGLTASSTTAVTSSYITVLANTGAVSITATPAISTATVIGGTTALPDGTEIVITSTGCPFGTFPFVSTVTYQDNGTSAGSRLHLGAATRAISCNKVLKLIYSAANTFWTEVSYTNNP